MWGEATIVVTADGRGLPAQVRTIARRVGETGGREAGNSFNRSLGKTLKKSDAFNSLSQRMKGLRGDIQRLSRSWRGLSYNARQWALIIGAVTAALPQIGTLAGAAGVGLLTLGSAFTSVGIGIGVTVAAFKRLTGDLDDVPADVRGARKAFDRLRDTLSDINGELTSRVFRDTEKAWDSLTDTVKGLREPLGHVADVVHDLITDFAKNLAPGTQNFENLARIISDSAGVFDGIVRSVGTFGSALLTAFANPAMVSAVDGLVGWIGDLAKGFDAFVNSPAYAEWVTNGVSVFEHLGGLITSIGGALSGLFDKQSTDNLNDFIDGLAQFFDGPGKSLIEFLDQLDIPGVVVDTLNNFGNALKPILDFATEFIRQNPEAVATALTDLATAFLLFKGGQIIVGAAGAMSTFWGALKAGKVSTITKMAGAVTGLTVALQGLSDQNATEGGAGLSAIGGALAGASLAGPIGALVGTLAGLIASMINDVFLTPEVKGSWQNGWDQLFDPNNYSGAGIGELKKWFQNNLMGPDPAIAEAGGGWLDQVVTRWGDTLEGFKTEIPNFFRDFGQAFADGWATVAAWYDTNFGQPIEQFWADTVNFFTVEVPGFFGSVGQWFATGWAAVAAWFDTNFGQPIERAWNGFVRFWTVEVPAFFTRAGQWFREGWAGVSRWFDQTFAQPVRAAWAGFVAFWTVAVPGWFSRMASEFQSGLARLASPFTSFFGDVKRNWENFWGGLGLAADNAWNTVRSTVDKIVSKIQQIASNPFGAIGSVFSGQGFASGGILTGPAHILAGEAGPEAIVPLNRSLGSVDPSVRALSAIAQGKTTAMASGGVVGAGRVQNNTFNINDRSGDPRRTANEVIRRLAMDVAG
ncbi:hypothetical protein [Microbacterium sp. NPDC058389]|uniref:hypothetical protein n=1 Tax=Microbacterium sp. NPDC058389 TaxID=3346475 RepID=UPI00366444A7